MNIGILKRIIISIFFICAFTQLGADDKNDKEIVAVIPRDFQPQYFVDKKGRPQGFAIDVMNETAKIAGYNVTYIIKDTWSEVNKTILSGNADVIPNSSITEITEKDYYYTIPMETANISLFMRESTKKIKNISDLHEKEVCIVKNNILQNIINTYNLKPHFVHDINDALINLLSGKSDAVIYPEVAFLNTARSAGLDKRIKIVGEPLIEIKRAIAVHKSQKELYYELDTALKSYLKTNHYKKTYRKWYGTKKYEISKILFILFIVIIIAILSLIHWYYYTSVIMKKKLLKANRSLLMLSNCNETLVKTNDEYELLTKICEIIIQVGKYRLAWVGYVDDSESKKVIPVAQYGFEDGYLEGLDITWDDTERGRGPTGSAIRTGKYIMAKDINKDQNFSPWRKEALKRNFKSSIALPLFNNGRVYGTLNIYSEEVNAFNEDEITLLLKLTDDLSYGINAIRIRNENKKVIDELKKSEEKHTEHEDIIKKSLTEKEILIKEIHHRVKNNMQVVSSLLGLQKYRVDNKEVLDILQDSINRVKAMALVHEKLYKNENFSQINFEDYIISFIKEIRSVYRNLKLQVTVEVNAKNIFVGIDSAVPCALILNELVTNCFKYAFPDNRKGTITINFTYNERQKTFILNIADDGIGLPENISFGNTNSLGFDLISSLTYQLEGDLKVTNSTDNGLSFDIEFPEKIQYQ